MGERDRKKEKEKKERPKERKNERKKAREGQTVHTPLVVEDEEEDSFPPTSGYEPIRACKCSAHLGATPFLKT